MSVDDHGLETLKKAAEEITPGDLSEYQYRVRVTESALPDGAATEATLSSFRSENDSNLESILAELVLILNRSKASTAAHTFVTPTANTSTQLLASNSARKWVIFVNNSGAAFFIKFGTTAVINQGIQIVQNGGSFFMDATKLYSGQINGIVGSNNRTIEIIEGT